MNDQEVIIRAEKNVNVGGSIITYLSELTIPLLTEQAMIILFANIALDFSKAIFDCGDLAYER